MSYFHPFHHTPLTVQQHCQCVRPTCCLLRIKKRANEYPMFIRSEPNLVASFWAVSEKHTHFSSGISQVQVSIECLINLQVLLYLSLKPTRVSICKAEHEGHICDSTGASVISLLPSICQSFWHFLCMTSRERPVPRQTRPTQNDIHQPCTLAAFEKLFPSLLIAS